MIRLGLMLFCTLALAAPASAQAVAEGSLSLGGKVVPLPPGPWRVLHQGTEAGRTSTGSLPYQMHSAVLVQERAGQAAALVWAHAATEMGTLWNPHGICTNTTTWVLQRHVESAIAGSLDCRGLVLVGSGRVQGTAASLNPFYDEGERRPGWIPPRWISVQIIQSQQMHFLSVNYRFAPGVFAPPTANAVNWAEGVRSAAQQDVVQRLQVWSERASAELRRGLYGRVPSAPLPSPF
ncbi:MAG: hypothetical protein RLZZ187_2383 [Pseudomonadota bacterium]|jgi:hypothetical protein